MDSHNNSTLAKNVSVVAAHSHLTFRLIPTDSEINLKVAIKCVPDFDKVTMVTLFKNSIGIEEITNNDKTNTEILNNYFTSVYVKEDNTELSHLNHIHNIPNMEFPISNEKDI